MFKIRGFCICKFAYLLKFLCNPQINSWGTFTAMGQMIGTVLCRMVKMLSHLMQTFPAEIEQSNALPSRFSSLTVNKCHFSHLFSATVFKLLCFLVAISPLKIAPKCSSEVLSRVPERSTGRLCCASQRKCLCQVSFVQARVTVLLAVSSVLMTPSILY